MNFPNVIGNISCFEWDIRLKDSRRKTPIIQDSAGTFKTSKTESFKLEMKIYKNVSVGACFTIFETIQLSNGSPWNVSTSWLKTPAKL